MPPIRATFFSPPPAKKTGKQEFLLCSARNNFRLGRHDGIDFARSRKSAGCGQTRSWTQTAAGTPCSSGLLSIKQSPITPRNLKRATAACARLDSSTRRRSSLVMPIHIPSTSRLHSFRAHGLCFKDFFFLFDLLAPQKGIIHRQSDKIVSPGQFACAKIIKPVTVVGLRLVRKEVCLPDGQGQTK